MKPVWDGAQFVPRLMVPLSLSYDHRVIDGAAAARCAAVRKATPPTTAAVVISPAPMRFDASFKSRMGLSPLAILVL